MANETDRQVASIDIEATMRLMDVADELRRQAREHEQVLGRLEAMERHELKEHLVTLYEGLDEEVDPALVEDAIDTFIAEQHRFREPPAGFALRLAQWYVRRDELSRKYGVPALVVSAIVATGFLGTDQWNRFQERRTERRVEIGVEALYSQWSELRSRIASLASEPALASLPADDRTRFDALKAQLETNLGIAEPFLASYAPDGDAEGAVTRANFLEVEERSQRIREDLRWASERASEANRLISFERSLSEMRLRLDRLVSEVRSASIPVALLERAERSYELGRESVERRQLEVAASHEAELSSIATEVETLATLAPRAAQLYESIRAKALEPSALAQSNALNEEAESYVTTANVSQLASVVERLHALEEALSLEYRIVIVGGVWRYENDNPGNRNYYLRVRAVGPGRGPMRMSITNEETNDAEDVLEWGERVPKEVYDRVAADKGDNGLIDDDTFGEKKRGYLTVERRYPDVGQITRW